LERNKINKLRKKSLKGTEKFLQVLKLSGNPLKSIENGTFAKHESIKQLYLDDTNLGENIQKASLHGLEKIRQIDLSLNKISLIENEAFRGLEITFQSIDISSNQISTMSKCIFERFPHLNGMRLGNNPLQCDCRLVWLYNWLKLHHPDFSRSMLDWVCAGPAHIKQKPFRLLQLNDFGCTNRTENETC
ncbi:hypothetical protein LOTGIDRAFT_76863, partial [Lottia gigantea]